VGPQGPPQTATSGAGETGAPAPALNLTTKPLPTFKDLSITPGLVIGDLKTLEQARNQLVDTWSEFHWVRSFLLLTLDTLTEVQAEASRPLSANEFLSHTNWLDEIVNNSAKERVEQLENLWQTVLITPLEQMDAQSISTYSLGGIEPLASDVLELLKKLDRKGTSKSQLKSLLNRIRAQIEAQLNGSLLAALDSCSNYQTLKSQTLDTVLNLTSTYAVPVCDGDPDFRRPENLDKPIQLFAKSPSKIPAALSGIYHRLAWLQLETKSWAEGFDVVSINNTPALAAAVQSRLPERNRWVTPGLGVFVGFPMPSRASSIAEVGQKLFYLQNNLIKIRRR
jgi:hypothetical protein